MHHLSHSPTPTGLGTKFWSDGSYRRYPGNTVVSMVPAGSVIYDTLVEARARMAEPLDAYVTFLPPSSWHMTVFDLLLDEVRDAARWSRFLDLDAPLPETDAVLRRAVASVPAPRPTMTAGVLRAQPGIVLDLRPVHGEMERTLRSYRERLSDATGIRAPNHLDYRFHLTMAYLITQPPVEAMPGIIDALDVAERVLADVGPFTLDVPDFRCFSDMGAFLVERLEDGLWVPEPDSSNGPGSY